MTSLFSKNIRIEINENSLIKIKKSFALFSFVSDCSSYHFFLVFKCNWKWLLLISSFSFFLSQEKRNCLFSMYFYFVCSFLGDYHFHFRYFTYSTFRYLLFFLFLKERTFVDKKCNSRNGKLSKIILKW